MKHVSGRTCKCIQCNLRRAGVKPGARRRVKRVKRTNPTVSVIRNPRRTSGEALGALRKTDFSQQHYRNYWIKTNNLNNSMWIERDGQLIARVPAWASWTWAQQSIDALLDGKPFPSATPPKTRVVRVKRNPAATRTAHVLSRRVYDLSYVHADDRGQPYRHKFAAGVTCQLLSDGSVRLFRPDGKPIWEKFED